MDPSQDEATIRRLLTSGSKALEFLADQVNWQWFSLRLKRRDAVLESVISDCPPEDLAALRNGICDDSGRLFPEETVRDAIKNTRTRVETVAFRKVASSGSAGKRNPPPQVGRGSGGSGPPPKVQKTSSGASASAGTSGGKGSGQPFAGGSGRGRKKQSKKKSKGGST